MDMYTCLPRVFINNIQTINSSKMSEWLCLLSSLPSLLHHPKMNWGKFHHSTISKSRLSYGHSAWFEEYLLAPRRKIFLETTVSSEFLDSWDNHSSHKWFSHPLFKITGSPYTRIKNLWVITLGNRHSLKGSMGTHAQVRAITPSREVSIKGLCEGARERIGLQNKESVATGNLQTQCLQLYTPQTPFTNIAESYMKLFRMPSLFLVENNIGEQWGSQKDRLHEEEGGKLRV